MANTLTEKLLQKVSVAAALQKKAGLEDQTEPGVKQTDAKDPASAQKGVISDVTTDVNSNEKHDLPGSKSDAATSAPDTGDKTGIDIKIPTNEDPENQEVKDIENSRTVVQKQAAALLVTAERIAGMNEQQTGALMQKFASAESDPQAMTGLLEDFIAKRADAGDPSCQALIDWMCSYYAGMDAKAADIDGLTKRASAEGQQVTSEQLCQWLDEQVLRDPTCLFKSANDDEDEDDDDETGEGAAPNDGAAPVTTPATGEEAALAATAASDAAAAAATADAGVDPAADAAAVESAAIEGQVAELIGQLTEAIKAQAPGISDEEAAQVAIAAIQDASATADAQQALSATDDSGAFVVPDEQAAAVIDKMASTASDFPLRGPATAMLNQAFNLDPSVFASRAKTLGKC
jgi:hypothetical protein